MSVGNKIKILRKKRKMTQDTLSENIVSRSMLSRIECGSAEPSMATLSAIAAKLEVAPSVLLEEDDNLLPAEHAFYLKKILECASKCSYKECLELFETAGESVRQNLSRVYVYCAFNVALDAFSSGDFSQSRRLLYTCLKNLDAVYPAVPAVNENNIKLILGIIDCIGDLQNLHTLASDLPDFSFQPSVFIYLLSLLNDGKITECEILSGLCGLDSHFYNYIKAQLLIKDYKLIDALILLKNVASKSNVPLFLKLMCYGSLENCCKLCEDYKGAYETHLIFFGTV